MRVVSPLLKTLVYPTLSAAGVFRRISNQGLAVVTYHGIKPSDHKSPDDLIDANLIRADVLRRQLRLLKENYEVICPEDVLESFEGKKKLPPKAVLLTCDDGLLNCLTDMLPILLEEGVRCLFFVTAMSADESRSCLWYEELLLMFLRARNNSFRVLVEGEVIADFLKGKKQRHAAWWRVVLRLSRLPAQPRAAVVAELRHQFGLGEPVIDFADEVDCRRYGLLIGKELRQVAAAGMTIGAHTITHPVLSQQNPSSALAEISGSRKILEELIGKNVWAFAYPFGNPQSIDTQVVKMTRECGYKAAFVNFGGGLGQNLPSFLLPRIHVTDRMREPEFEAHVSGFYAQLQASIDRRSAVEQSLDHVRPS